MDCDKQSIKIISIVVAICLSLAALDIAWTMFGPCKADVLLMLDDSGSVSNQDFNKVKQFIKKLANDEKIKDQMDDENVQIGMATFSECPKWMDQASCDTETPALKYVHNSYSMNQILNDYVRMESITDMIRALEFVNNQMLEYARPSSDKILLFMTDGNSQDSSNLPQSIKQIGNSADVLKNKGVKVFVIAVGSKTNQRELEAISSSKCESSGEDGGRVCSQTEKYIIKVDDFDGLDHIIGDLAGQVCNHQYWMAAVPIVVAILFVIVKVCLDKREAKMLDYDAGKMETRTPGMAV